MANCKIVIFYLVTVIIIILALEACLHLIYYARQGGFMWQSLETFNVRDLTPRLLMNATLL